MGIVLSDSTIETFRNFNVVLCDEAGVETELNEDDLGDLYNPHVLAALAASECDISYREQDVTISAHAELFTSTLRFVLDVG